MMTREMAFAEGFVRLGAQWIEDGGTLIRWSQRKNIVAGSCFHSDLIADEAWRRLVDQSNGIVARVPIEPAAITHVDGGSHWGAL